MSERTKLIPKPCAFSKLPAILIEDCWSKFSALLNILPNFIFKGRNNNENIIGFIDILKEEVFI